MNLHEAIKQILLDEPNGLTSSQIAEIINSKGLYKRKDNEKVPSSQITARISNYPSLFIKVGSFIKLKSTDELINLEESIFLNLQNLFDYFYSNYSVSRKGILEFIIDSIIKLDEQIPRKGIDLEFIDKVLKENDEINEINSSDINFLQNYVMLISKISTHPNRYRIIKKLIIWIEEDENNSYNTFLTEEVYDIIGNLNLFSDNNYIISSNNILTGLNLTILEHNQSKNFSFLFDNMWSNEKIMRLNVKLLRVSGRKDNLEGDSTCTGVFFPPKGIKHTKSGWSSEFVNIWNEINNDDERMTNAVVLMSPSALYFGGKWAVARRDLTLSQHVDAVITTPNQDEDIKVNRAAIVIFDFTKKDDKVFFADFANKEDFNPSKDWKEVANLYNSKVEIPGLSKFVSIEDIKKKGFSWVSSYYIFNEQKQKSIDGQISYKLSDVLKDYKKGHNIKRELMYEGGEVKYIRIRDLDKDKDYLTISNEIFGIDHDQLKGKEEIIKDGILVSLIGNELKANILKSENGVLLDINLAVLWPNSDIILEEYLIRELKSDNFLEQINSIRKGETIPFISLSDFLQLNIYLPTIQKQSEILNESSKLENNEHHGLNIQSKSDEKLNDYIGTIKHTLKQPIATLTEGIKSLKLFLEKKADEGVIDLGEITVPLEPGEKIEEWVEFNLTNTIERLSNAAKKSHWILEQGENLLNISTGKINLTRLFIKDFLINKMKDFPEITCEIIEITSRESDEKIEVFIDEKLWGMLIDNLVDNARKYGFTEKTKSKISFLVRKETAVDGNAYVCIEYKNNGRPFDANFDFNKFTQKGETSDRKIGNGFGGYFINSIIEKHKGYFEIVPDISNTIDEYKVKMIFYLPEI